MENLSIEEKIAIAKDINAPFNRLTELADNSDWRVRAHVAGNPNTSIDVLSDLAGDPEWCVRLIVARNQNTSADLSPYGGG